jgi:tungstate transport system ATP-binding protein
MAKVVANHQNTLLPLVLQNMSLDVPTRVGSATKRILCDVNLTIAPGARLCILGANGAGKSVLLRLMHGLLTPSSGEISTACGIPLTDNVCRQHDAMLFQRPVMLRRSAIDNVLLGLDSLTPRADTLNARLRADEALQKVGLTALAHRAARVLSGGEQQRVAFARVLARAPEVLYLDEPTASLDPQSARQIVELIDTISMRGTAIVLTTHNLALAKLFADNILFLHEGRITELTPTVDFFVSPRSIEAQAFLKGESL